MATGDKMREGFEGSSSILTIFIIGVYVLRIIFPKIHVFSKSKVKVLKNIIFFR